MKKAADVKYPSSANLFQFCRRVLDHKFGGIRVIDQDVGQILGFDPADCSHWKKGKKNIRSIQAMKSIAEHLGVDEKLVVDVAAGELDDTEAFSEYSGYGAFAVDPKVLEAAKKEFYRRSSGTWTRDKENEFRDTFTINEAAIGAIVEDIHQRINFLEAPLYLPEVITAYPELGMVPVTPDLPEAKILATTPILIHTRDTQTTISYLSGTEMQPYMRYRIAKAMAAHFLGDLLPRGDETNEHLQHLMDVQSNIFAAKLLAPAAMIRREIGLVNVSKDVVGQLAETFWVSKSFMNRRLKEILQSPL